MKKIIALALCAAMLLSLAACGGGDRSTPAEPTPTPDAAPETTPDAAPETTPDAAPEATPDAAPEPASQSVSEALEKYEKAMAEVLAADSLSLELAATTVRVVDGCSFEERATEDILWTGMKTDSPMIYRDRINSLFGYMPEYEYMYADGTVYIDGSFAVSMSAEEYIATLYPLQLLDTSLYAEVSFDENQLRFTQPGAPEAWLGIEPEELLEAEGLAVFGEDGSLEAVGCEVSYLKNGVETALEVYYGFTEINPALALDEHIPDAEEVRDLDDIRIVELLDRIYFGAGASFSETSNCSLVYRVDAGALYMTDIIELNVYGRGEELSFKIEETQNLTESGQQYGWNTTGTYIDGVYTVDSDGEVTSSQLDPAQMEPGVGLVSYVLTPDYIESAVVTEMNGYLVVEFEFDKQAGADMQWDMCNYLYGNGSLLDDLASAYATDTFEGYMAFNLDTLLPTGYAMEYAGHHTIEGGDYNISLKNYLSFDMTSAAAYKNIKGEALAESEPENKATPLFYKVTGENGQEMWLFGTIHVGDERTAFLPESIYSALDSSDALAVEVDISNLDKRMEEDMELLEAYSSAAVYSDLSTIEWHLGSKVREPALLMMKATGNYTANIEHMKTAVWTSSIENSYLVHTSSLAPEKGVDVRLVERAQEKGIEIREVESIIEQVNMLFGFSDKLQEYLMEGTLYYSRYDYAAEVEELYELWCAGDETALREMLASEGSDIPEEEVALYEEYSKAMYIDRNANMLSTAIEYLESGETVFYAVGLAHLIGVDGLVDALREAGYTVEIVK